MPVEVVRTIRASGGDYTSLSAFDAAEQRDLVALDEIAVAECYNDWPSGLNDQVTFVNWVTSATNYIHIRPAPGHGHTGKPTDASGNFTGFAMKSSVNDGIIYVDVGHCIIEDIIVENTRTSGAYVSGYRTSSSYVQFRRLIAIVAAGTAFNCIGGGNFSSAPWRSIASCAAFGPADASLGKGFNIPGGFLAYNCTAANISVGFGFSEGAREKLVKNCVAYNCTTATYDLTNANSTTNWTNNAASDGSVNTPPGQNPLTVDIVASDFVDVANRDIHLSSASQLIDKGADLSADIYLPFNYDIDGETRPGGSAWDIGADEYVPSGTPVSKDHVLPVSWKLNVRSDHQQNAEWLLELASSNQLPTEWLARILSDSTPPASWLSAARADQQLLAEWLGRLYADGPIQAEFLASLLSKNTIPTEFLASIAKTAAPNAEWLGSVARDSAFPASWRAALQIAHQLPATWLGSLSTERLLNAEWLGSLSSDSQNPVELLASVPKDSPIPVEWTGSTAIQSDHPLVVEWLSLLQADKTLAASWAQAVQSDDALPHEWLASVVGDHALQVAWLASARSDHDMPAEWYGSLAADRTLQAEWKARVAEAAAAQLEWLTGLGANYVIPAEILQKVLRDNGLPVEWTGGVLVQCSQPCSRFWNERRTSAFAAQKSRCTGVLDSISGCRPILGSRIFEQHGAQSRDSYRVAGVSSHTGRPSNANRVVCKNCSRNDYSCLPSASSVVGAPNTSFLAKRHNF